jgi:hypothetical protein
MISWITRVSITTFPHMFPIFSIVITCFWPHLHGKRLGVPQRSSGTVLKATPAGLGASGPRRWSKNAGSCHGFFNGKSPIIGGDLLKSIDMDMQKKYSAKPNNDMIIHIVDWTNDVLYVYVCIHIYIHILCLMYYIIDLFTHRLMQATMIWTYDVHGGLIICSWVVDQEVKCV